MSENMICPACNHFQPKAEECAECGVIIAKAQQAKSAEAEPDIAPAVTASGSGGGLPAPLIVAVVAVVLGLAYFLFSGGEDSQPAPEAASVGETGLTPVQEATAGKLQRANAMITTANTQQKLRALVTKLNFVSIQEGLDPPSAEEGLRRLVNDGVLNDADIRDAWGNEFIYELKMGPDMGVMGQEYEIRLHSAGPDGINGTPDDVGV